MHSDIGEGHGVVYASAEEQINMALSIRERANELGAQARAYVEKYCDWVTITDEFETLLLRHTEKLP